MTERKWRIIKAATAKQFYEKVEKYEKSGYKLLPESFGLEGWGTSSGYYALMINEAFK